MGTPSSMSFRSLIAHSLFFFFFWSFLEPHLLHVEVPGLGVESAAAAGLPRSYSNLGIRATSVTYTAARGNARFLID